MTRWPNLERSKNRGQKSHASKESQPKKQIITVAQQKRGGRGERLNGAVGLEVMYVCVCC
jgi:hypothetical protein